MNLLDQFNREVNQLLHSKTDLATSLLYACKSRFALIGTVGAGKSTIAAGIALTTQTLSSQQPDFFCRILERNSNIYGDVSNLRSGRFPEKTVAYDSFATEAGLLLGVKKRFTGYKFLQVPVCDVAGEDLQLSIKQYRQQEDSITNASFTAAANLIRYVKESEGFIVATDASRAIIGRNGEQLETEKSDKLHRDPDVNLVRILNEIFNYKDQVRRPIKGMAIVITKWDAVHLLLENRGIDILNPNQTDLSDFMDTCYPSVSQAIKAYQQTHNNVNIQYFPTFFTIKRDKDNKPIKRSDDTEIVEGKQSGSWRDMRKPSYSAEQYGNLISWLLSFAG